MTPRPRHELDPSSDNYNTRWAIHLRTLLDRQRLTAAEFRKQLEAVGLEVSLPSVKAWLRGRRLPRLPDLESIAAVLKVADYRRILPPPRR